MSKKKKGTKKNQLNATKNQILNYWYKFRDSRSDDFKDYFSGLENELETLRQSLSVFAFAFVSIDDVSKTLYTIGKHNLFNEKPIFHYAKFDNDEIEWIVNQCIAIEKDYPCFSSIYIGMNSICLEEPTPNAYQLTVIISGNTMTINFIIRNGKIISSNIDFDC